MDKKTLVVVIAIGTILISTVLQILVRGRGSNPKGRRFLGVAFLVGVAAFGIVCIVLLSRDGPRRAGGGTAAPLPAMRSTLPPGLEENLMPRFEPSPPTKIDAQAAIAISRKAYQDGGLVGINHTEFTPRLCKLNGSWVWQVDWVCGRVEIAAVSGAITVDAETGKVLYMYKSTQMAR